MTTPLPNASTQSIERTIARDLRQGAENQSFIDLTLLAAQICDCELAFVTIVSSDGDPSTIAARSTAASLGPACVSLVAKAMAISQDDRIVTISDLLSISVFSTSCQQAGWELAGERAVQPVPEDEAARSPAADPVRFFCGVRLLTPTQLDVGVLCVLDTQPHVLSDRQYRSLEALGRQATGMLRSLHAFGSNLVRPAGPEAMPELPAPRPGFETILRTLPSYQGIVDILERVTDALFSVDDAWRLTYLNTHAERLWDLDRDDAVGRDIWSCMPEWVGTDFEDRCREAVRSRRSQKFKHYDKHLESWLDVRVYPSPGRISVYLHDVEPPRTRVAAERDDISVERAHTSALMTAVSAALGQSQPLEQSLELCASALENNLEATSVGIWLVDRNLRSDNASAKDVHDSQIDDPSLDNHSRVKLAALSGQPFPEDLFPTTVVWQESSTSWIAHTPYPYCINNLDGQTTSGSSSHRDLQAIVCYPLVVEERPIGTLVLGCAHVLPDSSHDILTWVANGIAIAVDRIWARDILASRRKSLLFSLANQIRKTLELDTILTTAVEEIRSLLNVDRCYYIWCAIEGEAQILAVTHENIAPDLDSWIGDLPPTEEARLGASIIELESLYIDDAAKEDTATREALESMGIASQLVLPLGTRANQFGAIVCTHQEARTWTHGEVEILHAAVDQLAIAIDQAELYAKTCAAARAAETQANKLQDAMRNLKKTEAQLVQNEKMSSLGQMVAGIAHEINNPVNFISGNLTHASNYISDLLGLIEMYGDKYPEPDDELLDEIEEIDLEFLQEDLPNLLKSMRMGADRIREIVLSLRNFSRLDEADMKPVQIADGIDSTLLILRSRIKAQPDGLEIEVVRNYAELPPVDCFPGSLNQVFMNLIANAIDAEEERRQQEDGHPCITIGTEAIGDRVQISVSDNGSGIPQTLIGQLFDPFFTTKPVGKGTGLGLSISYQIVVEQHGGRFWCESEVGEGTTFFVEIPIHQEEDEGMESVAEQFREFLTD